MSAELMLRWPADAASGDGNLNLRFENTINTPLVSASWLANGQAIAGTYVLVFTRSGGVTVDVTGQGDASTSRNPWADRTGLSVVADGATENVDMLPGVGLVVDPSVDTGWTCVVTIGNRLDPAAAWTEVLEFEIVQAGAQSSERQIAVRNVGTDEAEQCYLYALPGSYFYGTGAEQFIQRIAPHTDPTRHKLASVEQDLAITLTDWADDLASGKKKCNVRVNGNIAVTGALFDGSTVYQHGVAGYDDGNDYLAGMSITLPDTTDDPTSTAVTLAIRAGYTWVEWAPDVAGSPGAWQSADLSLGAILPNAHVLAWIRVSVPSAATPDDPCRMVTVRARGLSI